MRLNDLKGGRLRLIPCSLIISALLLIMSVACSKDDVGISEPTTIPVSSIKLNPTSVTLNVGESVDLTATVSPENATNKMVTWSSSDAKIATVSNGKVTAVAVGKATITAQCGNIKAECAVTVSPIEATSIKLSQTSATLTVGESVQLTAAVSPDNATDKTVIWSSSNTSVATVSNGKVTAVAVGEATTTAQCGNVKAECTITVKATEVTSIKLNQNSATMYAGETLQLTATVSPENATNKNVTWISSNTSVATVTNGKVTAVAVGTATITAQCGNVKAECTITVKAAEVTSIKLNQTSATLYASETIQLTATVSPDNATDKTVTWSSSNTSVATVSNGKVTAIAVGKAIITAQCGNVKAECTITVKATEVTSIALNRTSVTLSAGETVQLTATVSPDNATNKTVTWSSSNTSVATVSNGKVTAVAVGTAIITAQCGNVKAECTITVKATEETPNLPATPENIAGTWLLAQEKGWEIDAGEKDVFLEYYPDDQGSYETFTFDEDGSLTWTLFWGEELDGDTNTENGSYSISGKELKINIRSNDYDDTHFEIKKLTESQLVLFATRDKSHGQSEYTATFKRIE